MTARINLIVLPFAASSSFMYQGLKASLDPFFDVRIYELPGHGVRFDEEFLTNSESVENDLVSWTGPLRGPTLLFGHCLGAFLALALEAKLRQAGVSEVASVLSGFITDSSSQNQVVKTLDAAKDELFDIYVDDRLLILKGVPAEMHDYIKDMIFADSRLLIDFIRKRPRDQPLPDSPVIWGKDDPLYSRFVPEGAQNVAFLDGEHLFFLENTEPFLQVLRLRGAALVREVLECSGNSTSDLLGAV